VGASSPLTLLATDPVAHPMPKKAKLQAAVLEAKINWRNVCANRASTVEDRHRAYAAWKKAESALTRTILLLKSGAAERRVATVDRRGANANSNWLEANSDRRKTVRRP
jgi:hypothetical protein